jgi:cation channel sperm-associated protein 3
VLTLACLLIPLALRPRSEENLSREAEILLKRKTKTNANPNNTYYNLKKFVRYLITTKYFSNFILFVIFLNCISIAVDASLPDDATLYSVALDGVFLGIYMTEFILKIFVSWKHYFASGYNRFDFGILLASVVQFLLSLNGAGGSNLTVFRVFRALRALRSFRSISSVRRLQIIVNALLSTLRNNVLDIIACLFTSMFLFAVMGYYLFGETQDNDIPNDFQDLPTAFFTLMLYVTSSGWTNVQNNMTSRGFAGSEAYSILFMFLGNFIFTNSKFGVAYIVRNKLT